MERRMADPVVRDVDVVSQSGAFGKPETATATASGGAITVVSSASTAGANLQAALTTAGTNSTVILSGSFNTGGAITTLQSGQTLMGAGSITVRAPSGRTATLTTPAATLTGDVGGSNRTVVMANNSTLMGMTINNTDTTNINAQAVGASGVSRSEEHTSELQSLMRISYAVFCLKQKKNKLLDVQHIKHRLLQPKD